MFSSQKFKSLALLHFRRLPPNLLIAFAILPICTLSILSGDATAQVATAGVMPVHSPRSGKECIELSSRWYEKVKELERASNACSIKDGGTIKASGVWMPNCGRLLQAYVTCAPVEDQLCSVRNQQTDAVRDCNEQVSVYQAGERTRESEMQRLRDQVAELQRAVNSARSVQEMARTAGTTHPDSQPALNRTGDATDRMYRTVPRNSVITEIGSQSAAAARARAGDALNQLDGALNRDGPSPARSLSRIQVDGDEGEEEREAEAAQARTAAQLEMIQKLNSTLQSVVQARQQGAPGAAGNMNGPPSRASQPGTRSGHGVTCRSPEIVGPNVNMSLPLCKY